MSDFRIKISPEDFSWICSPKAVRERSHLIYKKALSGETHFIVHENKISECADYVQKLILKNHPDLKVPFHSRWEHFNAGNSDRLTPLAQKCKGLSPTDYAVLLIDLVVLSVFLDAGAGAQWSYKDKKGQVFHRSEALAVASIEAFENGLFSSNSENKLRVDAQCLIDFNLEKISAIFQVSAQNPLVGLEGRLKLIQSLGHALKNPLFEHQGDYRIGHLLYRYLEKSTNKSLSANTLLEVLILAFSEMWPARSVVNSTNFGDLWHYPQGSTLNLENLYPFHKLSQWLSYSMIHPLEVAGLSIPNPQALTGLPEYRNGGLFLDMGVLELRKPELLKEGHTPQSDLIVEWRALTICLLDALALKIREFLKLSEAELPLGKVLQGGTWLAGREWAQKLRGGEAPIKIKSDGTVF